MSLPDELSSHKIQFYVTTSYACGYIEGRASQSLVATPHHLISQKHFDDLIKKAFEGAVNLRTNLIANFVVHVFLFVLMLKILCAQKR